MSLPSLKSLRATSLFIDPRGYKSGSALLSQQSNITDLNFNGCLVRRSTLSELLSKVKSLDNFTYKFTHNLHDDACKPAFDWDGLVATLARVSKDTLERLTLDVSPEVASYQLDNFRIDSLCAFTVLQDVDVSTSLIFAADGSNLLKCANHLPVSIEKIILRWVKEAPVVEAEALTGAVRSLAQDSKDKLPHSRRVKLHVEDKEQALLLLDALCLDEISGWNPQLSVRVSCSDPWEMSEEILYYSTIRPGI